ncbi:MAG: ribonuclease, partial [Pacificimonas sp.]
MSDWYCERGIGETRYACIDNDEITDAFVRREGWLAHGSQHEAHLTLKRGRRGEAAIGTETVFLPRWPDGATEGETRRLTIMREAIPERGRP